MSQARLTNRETGAILRVEYLVGKEEDSILEANQQYCSEFQPVVMNSISLCWESLWHVPGKSDTGNNASGGDCKTKIDNLWAVTLIFDVAGDSPQCILTVRTVRTSIRIIPRQKWSPRRNKWVIVMDWLLVFVSRTHAQNLLLAKFKTYCGDKCKVLSPL